MNDPSGFSCSSFEVAVHEFVARLDAEIAQEGLSRTNYVHSVVVFDHSAKVRIHSAEVKEEAAALKLTLFDEGHVSVYVDPWPNPLSEGIWQEGAHYDTEDVVRIIVNVARYGIVWTGYPFRGWPLLVAPTIPDSGTQLNALRQARHVRISRPWVTDAL